MTVASQPSQDDDLKDRDGRADSLALLRQIGEDLDQDKSLIVSRGGTVWPSAGQPLHSELGTEEGSLNGAPIAEPTRAGRSTARQGQGTTRHGAAGSSARATAPLLRQLGVREWVVKDVVGAGAAYPQLMVRPAPATLWLDMRVFPLRGYPRGAFLQMAFPLDASLPVEAWAWWTDGLWIGPRHTNYGKGSVCSYEPTDGTWSRRKPLVLLLDLISTWVVRHIHLLEFARWPGAQVLHTARERLTETRPGERCGCGSSSRYEECHHAVDLQLDPRAIEEEFRRRSMPWRQPPTSRSELEEIVARTATEHPLYVMAAERSGHPRLRLSEINVEVLRQFRAWRRAVEASAW